MQYDLGELAEEYRGEEGDKEIESSKFEWRGQSGNSFVVHSLNATFPQLETSCVYSNAGIGFAGVSELIELSAGLQLCNSRKRVHVISRSEDALR